MKIPATPTATTTRAMLASALSLPVFALALATLATPNAAHAQKLETIALYDFSNATNIFEDASGKKNHLSKPTSGVSQSTTEYSTAAPTEYSAYFDGTQTTGGAKQINFSTYTALTFDWHMKAAAMNDKTYQIFQTGYQSDLAGCVTINLVMNADSTSAELRISHRLAEASSWGMASFTIAAPTSWKHYELTIDNSDNTATGHITFSLNGIVQTAISSSYSVGKTGSFVTTSQYSRIGRNGANTDVNSFKGYLQNFEIYAGTPTPVPEPATTAMLIGLAGALLAFIARRHGRR
ncbi:PEP-CTERM sorting domain-containing protein [Geminisphaera colitermitum]|uniref:PEP-CTERM sorting domain-containing protein n=1 Tax=Geminisphaera colitermitum TaxID=1148786 RepID=UPI000158C863|nr:PEP-CTERM sorting domain-containing protein [Geminisphaera colitermitum]